MVVSRPPPSSSKSSDADGDRRRAAAGPSTARRPAASGYSNVSSAKKRLGLLGEQELDQVAAPRSGSSAVSSTLAAVTSSSEPRSPSGKKWFSDVRVGVLGLGPLVVVVVHEPHGDLAPADRLDDGDVVGVDAGVVGGHARRATPSVSSSPSSTRMAVTKSWNEALVGATATRPVELGVGQVEDRVGQVGLGDQLGVVDERPHPAGEPDPAAVVGAGPRPGTRSSTSSGSSPSRPCWSRKPTAPGLWERNTSAGELSPSSLDEQGEVGGVAVADVDVDAGLLGELLEQRADEVLGAAGVDGDARRRRCVHAGEPGDEQAPRRRRRRASRRRRMGRQGSDAC